MFYWRESDLGMSQLLMVFILPLFIVLHALWPESISTASPLCSLLAALYKIPGFLSTVPAHCLAPSCPLNQTGMTLGTLPAAQCSNVSKAGGGRCGVGGWGGSDKQIVLCQTRLVGGQSWKSLHRPQWGSTSMKKCDVMRGNAFWETDLLVTAAKQGSAQDTRHTET